MSRSTHGSKVRTEARVGMKKLGILIGVMLGAGLFAAPADAFRAPDLSAAEKKTLKDNFALCVGKLKGPYTENFCVCPDGAKHAVRSASGALGTGCKDPIFCAAYRAPWAEALAKDGVYIANVFSRDLYLWDTFTDHNDLVRGYVLENYFIETNPTHKFAELRAFGGLSGAEYETGASVRFFERYLSTPEFNDTRNFLLAYELQRRFFLHADLGQIEKVRAIAVRVQAADPRFKPLRDAVHNQMSAGLIPRLVAYRDKLPAGSERAQIDEMIGEITKLTSSDESALARQVAALEDGKVRTTLAPLVPTAATAKGDAISSLAQLMIQARQDVAAHTVSATDARRLVDADITAAAAIQRRGSALLEDASGLTAGQYLKLLSALTDATYGAGLLTERERTAAGEALHDLRATSTSSRAAFQEKLARATRVVEWAQANAVLAFAEVWTPWTLLMPSVAGIRDDILRSSPLLLYGQVLTRVTDYAQGGGRTKHDIFGAEVEADVRALNPGLAVGRLRVAPAADAYTRDQIVALPETPADLDPAAGILTQGEGNVLSHVQLLARALGIPNVVVGPSVYQKIKPHDGQQVFFIVTPGGRVILKEAAAMTAQDHAVYDDFTRNERRAADGSLAGGGPRLHIDRTKVDLSKNMPIDLDEVRRSDSGRFCGPKAAYLGELKHLFPDQVARAREAGRAAGGLRRADVSRVLRGDDPGREGRAGAGDLDRAAARGHPDVDPRDAALARAGARDPGRARPEVAAAAGRQDPERRLLRAERHQRRGSRQLQWGGAQPHRVQPEVARRHLLRSARGLGVAVRVPLVLLAADADRRPDLGAVVGRHPRVGGERQVRRARHRGRQFRRPEGDDGRDVGGSERRRRWDVGGDAALGAGSDRAGDHVQVALEEPAPPDRGQHHRPRSEEHTSE